MRILNRSESHSQSHDSPRPYGGGLGRPHTTEVNLLLSAGAGVVLAVLFILVVGLVSHNSRLGQIVLNRGWVTKAEVGLAAWAVSFMVLKYLQIRRQRNLANNNPLRFAPQKFADRDDLQEAAARLADTENLYGNSILHRRIFGGLERANNDGNRTAVADSLHSLGLVDAARTENSYSLLRVLIWAIPIIGFIGTVAGLGGAVGGFSESLAHATDFVQLKSLLGGVTAGLSVAFDATFVALLISLALMFPASLLEKRELDFLTDVDEFCQHELLGRLNDTPIASNNSEEMVEAFRKVIERQQESFILWWKQANTTLMATFQAAGEKVNESVNRLREAMAQATEQSVVIGNNLKTGADQAMNIAECLRGRAESEGVNAALGQASISAKEIAGNLISASKHSANIPSALSSAEEHAQYAASSAKKIDEMFQSAASASERLEGNIEKAMRAASQNVAASMASQMEEFNMHTSAVAKLATRLRGAIGVDGAYIHNNGNGNGEL